MENFRKRLQDFIENAGYNSFRGEFSPDVTEAFTEETSDPTP